MSELFEGTPINLIKDSEVKWQISYDIYPIQLTQAVRIVDFIAEDKFFENFDVGGLQSVTSSYMCRTFGNGSCVTSRNKEAQTIDVIRVM